MKIITVLAAVLAAAWSVPGWELQPAGTQVPVDTLPMSMTVTSDSKYLLVLNGGFNPPSISVIDVAARSELRRTPLPDAWLGLVAAHTRNVFYVGGGSTGKVYELSLGPDGTSARTREFEIVTNAGGAPFIGDVALSPDERVLYAADLYGDSIAEINLQTGKMTDHWRTGRRPYRIVVSPDGAQLLVSSWAEAAVYQHSSTSGVLIAKLRVGPHPTDMLWIDKPIQTENGGTAFAGRLFVTSSNTNTVYSFGVTQDKQFTALDSISVATTPLHPLGMTPSALAVDERGTRLYVVCSDANAVAVADLSLEHPKVFGFIPTAEYPTAVRVLSEGQLAILNSKGFAGEREQKKTPLAGAVSFTPIPNSGDLRTQTETVLNNSPYSDELLNGPIRDQQEAYFSLTQERASPIQHVIYVIKGSQSSAALLSDSSEASANHRKFAREFATYDNFYSNGFSPAEGQNWLTAAIVPDYTVKLWQSERAGRHKVYDFEGGEPANTPPAGYLWNNALQAGLTVRNYGEWVKNTDAPNGSAQIAAVKDPALATHTDRNYRGADPAYKDVDRVKEFVREWKEFDRARQAPQLSIVRLSNDGGQRGSASASALLADNDAALGMLVDSVSHSKLWETTAIFVVEAAPAQDTSQAEDHRIPAFILSPYTHHRGTDSRPYNQMNMLRTIECILGLRPMTHFDGAARPMFAGFNRQRDSGAFDAAAQDH